MKRRVGMAMVLALAAIGAAAPAALRERVVFVVAPGSRTADLSSAELRRIVLGQTTRWNDRRRIVLCLRPTDSPEGRLVLERLARMSGIDYSQHWLGAVFRGDAASVPRVFDTRAALLQAVAENPDAIGFVLAGEPVAPLREVTVDGKAPADPAYPLAR
jgi:ABC-type phosphate transport system substrate-binding protein